MYTHTYTHTESNQAIHINRVTFSSPPQSSVVPEHFNGKLKACLMSVVFRTGMRAVTEDKSDSVAWQDITFNRVCVHASVCLYLLSPLETMLQYVSTLSWQICLPYWRFKASCLQVLCCYHSVLGEFTQTAKEMQAIVKCASLSVWINFRLKAFLFFQLLFEYDMWPEGSQRTNILYTVRTGLFIYFYLYKFQCLVKVPCNHIP